MVQLSKGHDFKYNDFVLSAYRTLIEAPGDKGPAFMAYPARMAQRGVVSSDRFERLSEEGVLVLVSDEPSIQVSFQKLILAPIKARKPGLDFPASGAEYSTAPDRRTGPSNLAVAPARITGTLWPKS